MALCKKILVIDDDPFTRDLVARTLSEAGHHVETVSSPADGIKRCIQEPGGYGVVFMDVSFPEGNIGYVAAQDISKLAKLDGPKIIGMTGYSDLYDYEHRSEFGMVDVILKPLHKHLLVQLADAHLQ